MKKIIGLYIEDDLDNIKSYGRYFKAEGIDILAPEKLFTSPEDYYEYVCENDVDFVIIDNHLDKQGVNYDGFEVLENIRKQDSTIYLLLLTNYDFQDRKELLGEFDQTISKIDFTKEFDEIISRVKRAYRRRMLIDSAEIVEQSFERKENIINEEIDELKEINKILKEINNKNKSG